MFLFNQLRLLTDLMEKKYIFWKNACYLQMSKTKNKAESVFFCKSVLTKNDFVTSILKRLQLLKQETKTKAAKKRDVSSH